MWNSFLGKRFKGFVYATKGAFMLLKMNPVFRYKLLLQLE
jgi:hypothetical protein